MAIGLRFRAAAIALSTAFAGFGSGCGADDVAQNDPGSGGSSEVSSGPTSASGGGASGGQAAGSLAASGGSGDHAGGSAGLPEREGGAGNGQGDAGGQRLPPNPIISRGKQVESPQASAAKAFDGDYTADSSWNAPPTAQDGSVANTWVKINVGSGPKKLLLVWHHNGTPDYTITPDINFGAPGAYTIDVSPTGADGTWTNVVTITGDSNTTSYRSRGHSFAFDGMSWVRMTVTKVWSKQPGPPHMSISEIDVHDITGGSQDTWLVAGSAMTRFAYDGHVAPLFPALIHDAHAAYYPALIDIADLPGSSQYLLANVDGWLALNPDFHFWILTYGLTDAEGNSTPTSRNFKQNMQATIDKLKKAGVVPLLPRAQKTNDTMHSHTSDFNAIIDQLVLDNDLPPAPDFYAWFSAHPEQLCTTGCESPEHIGVDPNDAGYSAMNELCAKTFDSLYAP